MESFWFNPTRLAWSIIKDTQIPTKNYELSLDSNEIM